MHFIPRLSACILLMLCMLPAAAGARVTLVDAGTGLPDKFITAICRDKRGLMWIGTKQGVCNYDGSRFEAMEGDLKSDASVTRLIYDAPSDQLWAATSKGLYIVHCGSQQSSFIGDKTAWTHNSVTDICRLDNGTLYAAYVSGELAHISNSGQLNLLYRFKAVDSRQPFANHLAAAANGELNYQLSGRPDWYILHLKTKQTEKLASITRALAYRRSFGDTLVTEGGQGGVSMLKGDVPLFPQAQQWLAHLTNLTDIWFTSPGTCYILCKQTRLYYIDLASGKADTISSEVFNEKLGTCLFLDGDNILWVGTNKGLIKVTRDKPLFTATLIRVPPVSIRSLAEDESGNIYAGTYSGLFRRTPNDAQWQKINTEIFYAMLNVPGPYMYLVTEQLHFFRMDKRSLRIDTGFYKRGPLPEGETLWSSTLSYQSDSTVWIGTSSGLVAYHIASNTLAAVPVKGLPEHTRVISIAHMRNGHLLLSTRSGIFEMDLQKGIVWSLNAYSNPALPVSSVNYSYEDGEGRLWLCTQGGGINIVSANRKQITVLKTEAGLSDNETYQMLWQGDARAWISTFNGLSSYNPRTGSFYNFYTDDGISTNEFNLNAFLKASSGRMYFGGINGITTFSPDSIPELKGTAGLFVSSIIKWDNKRQVFVHLNPVDTATTIEMNPLDYSLTFDLALTDYHNPEAQIFQYRIKGLFDEWVTLNSLHSLKLYRLAPGRYTLEIKATDSRGAPAVNTLQYHIQVGQLFYRTAWFYLLLFVLASGLLWAFFYLRLQNVKRVQKIREQLASDLHDEVGSLLTRITMTSDNLQYSRNTEPERASKLQKIASLSRTAASSMSDILWAIDARNDYTGNLADRMREHAEEMLSPREVHPEFDFVVNQRMSISSELRQQLYLLYKEAINNIVKHSEATDVRISYHHNEQGFRLSIINNGVTAKERTSTRGQGLKNIQMRARRIHATAIIKPEGDRFIVIVERR